MKVINQYQNPNITQIKIKYKVVIDKEPITVAVDMPPLLSNDCIKADEIKILCQIIELIVTVSGHYTVPIVKTEINLNLNIINVFLLNGLPRKKNRKATNTIHLQIGLITNEKIITLINDDNINDPKLTEGIREI